MLPEVAVTATSFAQPYADQPADITIIDAADIANSTARNLPELLSRQPGIVLRDLFGNNGSNATVDMRGFGADADQNTLVLIDGRRLTDIDLSGVQWSALPLAAIARVEILRGSGAVLYGGGASAGVINIITRSPLGGSSAWVSAGAGSYGSVLTQGHANLGGEHAGLSVIATNYTSNGWRDNNATRQSDGLADARWDTTLGTFDFKLAADGQGTRLPGGRTVQPSTGLNEVADDPRGTSTPLDWAQREGQHALLDWKRGFDFGELDIGAGYRNKQQKSYFDFSGFPDYRETRLQMWSFTPRLRLALPVLGHANSLVAGVDAYRWDYALQISDGPQDIHQPINDVNARQRNTAFYLQDTLNLLPSLTASAGWRHEHFSIDATDSYDGTAPGAFFGSAAAPGSQSLSLNAWELGLRHAFMPQWAWFANAGRGYRYATVDETYETSALFTNQFQFLKPQINRSLELGAEWQPTQGDLRLALFNINIDDEIHLDAYTTGVGNTNLPPSRRRGVELTGHWRPADTLELGGGVTYTDARFREGVLPGDAFTVVNLSIAGKTVPLVPRWKADTSASWRFAPGWALGGSLTWVGSSYMDNDEGNTGTRIPAYALADIKLSRELGAFKLSLAVNNLFDRDYYTYAVRSQFVADRYSAYSLPGRTAWLTLEYAWDGAAR